MAASGFRYVAISFALVSAVACSSDPDEGGSATGRTGETGATAVETGPSTPADPTGEEALPLAVGELAPGTYVFEGFGEPMRITLGEGWQADMIDDADLREGETRLAQYFALFNADHPAANVAFLAPTRMVDPTKDWDEEANVVPLPADLIDYFASHPDMEAQTPVETSIGGRPATSVETIVIDVPSRKQGWPPCGGACILWTPITADNETGPLSENDTVWGAPLDELDRHIVLEVGGNQLWIDIGAIEASAFEDFLPLAEEVLSTVEFG